MLGTETQRHLPASFNRFVDGVDELKTLPSNQAIHKVLLIIGNAIDYMFVISLMTKSIDVGGIDRLFFHHIGIAR